MNTQQNINNVQQNEKLTIIQDHSLKIMEAFRDYPVDYIRTVLQMTVATALIEYSGKEYNGEFSWNVVDAIDNSVKFLENVQALIKINNQTNGGIVIAEA